MHVASVMYKVYNNVLPKYIMDMFTPHSTAHGHNTRQCDDYHVPYHRFVLNSNIIHIHAVNVWNSICKDIRNIQTFKLFRTTYKFDIVDS